jgi:hypothetical protein
MAQPPQETSGSDIPSPIQGDEQMTQLIQTLRRKEGNWVEWGQACQTLQKAGYSPQAIFEDTGFEPLQQNQVIVGAQVYHSIVAAGADAATLAHFERKGSDVLYELRILTNVERAAVAELVVQKGLDMDEAREVAKAVKNFSRLSQPPVGFTTHAGDAIAYQIWKLARQQSDLQERSRLIARGLRFAHSDTARHQIEQLLTDFSVTPTKPAPRLPVYRLDTDEELPRVIPVVGQLPLALEDFKAVPFIEPVGSFGMVQFAGACAWVAVPGWQVVRLAEDPIALLSTSDSLPTPLPGPPEPVLVIIDRAERIWDEHSYFLIVQEEQLQLQWFTEAPETALLGRLILIMKPKKVLDEDYTKDPWQIDE